MAGNTLGDMLKAGQLDLLKQVSSNNKSDIKKPAMINTTKSKQTTSQAQATGKTSVADDYKIFHSYVRNVVHKSELYDTMFDYGGEESFAAVAELYDDPVSKDIIDYFACRFFDGEYDYLDSIAAECEQGNNSTPDEYAIVLGHKIPITYRDEYDLLSSLCSTALNLDGHFNDDPVEETVIVYNRTSAPTASVPEQEYALSYQNHSPKSVTKQGNTKALRKAQEVVNVPKKGSQVQHVKVVKQPATPKHSDVKEQATIPIKQQNQHGIPLSPVAKIQTTESVKKVKQQSKVQLEKPTPIVSSPRSVVNERVKAIAENPKQPMPIERRETLQEIHKRKTKELRAYLDENVKLLGLTDEVVELFIQEKYRAIFVIFISSCRKYFLRQQSLGEEAFNVLWNKAHNYVYEFVNGEKRQPRMAISPVRPARKLGNVGYKKRSFSSHIATSGVWGRIAAYGGTNGKIININAGHGRR